MKTLRLKLMLSILLLFLLMHTGCKEDKDHQILPCEIIANAHLSNFLKVVNQSSSKILVRFGTIPFGATMQVNACELTGLPTGAHYVEISKCEGEEGNCTPIGSTIREDFILNAGETHTITVTDNYF